MFTVSFGTLFLCFFIPYPLMEKIILRMYFNGRTRIVSKNCCSWVFILILVIRELARKKETIYLGICDYFQPIT